VIAVLSRVGGFNSHSLKWGSFFSWKKRRSSWLLSFFIAN